MQYNEIKQNEYSITEVDHIDSWKLQIKTNNKASDDRNQGPMK